MTKIRHATLLILLTLAISVMGLFPIACASAAKTTKHKVVVATGGVTCTKVTGTVTFTPPVRHVGTTTETQTVTFRASGCRTTGSNVKHVTAGVLRVVVHRPSNSCIGLLSTVLPKSTGTWVPSSIHSTTAAFSGLTFVYSKTGDVGFTVPNSGGTARVSGSFAGRDHGKRSTATVYTNMTPTQFRDACISSAGLARQSIVSGIAKFS